MVRLFCISMARYVQGRWWMDDPVPISGYFHGCYRCIDQLPPCPPAPRPPPTSCLSPSGESHRAWRMNVCLLVVFTGARVWMVDGMDGWMATGWLNGWLIFFLLRSRVKYGNWYTRWRGNEYLARRAETLMAGRACCLSSENPGGLEELIKRVYYQSELCVMTFQQRFLLDTIHTSLILRGQR